MANYRVKANLLCEWAMVREISIGDIDGIAQPIVAIGKHYLDGHHIAPHIHRRNQLLSSRAGTLLVITAQGAWVMPPQRGMWIPAGIVHEVRALGEVHMQSLYLEPGLLSNMPEHTQVVNITPFMRMLLSEALDVPLHYEAESRSAALINLIEHELRRLSALPLALPYPEDADIARRCFLFLRQPNVHETSQQWSADLNMSLRSFTRLFRQQTGMSFVEWRQQACLMISLPRLAAGDPVTTVALELGYDNPASFTTMFKRVLGASPRDYLRG